MARNSDQNTTLKKITAKHTHLKTFYLVLLLFQDDNLGRKLGVIQQQFKASQIIKD